MRMAIQRLRHHILHHQVDIILVTTGCRASGGLPGVLCVDRLAASPDLEQPVVRVRVPYRDIARTFHLVRQRAPILAVAKFVGQAMQQEIAGGADDGFQR